MTIVLGGSGYIGEAFVRELESRGEPVRSLSRADVDYSRFDVLLRFLRETGVDFLINAAGYTGRPNVDACEIAKADTLHGNALFPAAVSHACRVAGIPWGHVSSGCIYSGAKIRNRIDGSVRVEKDLTTQAMREVQHCDPGAVLGFTEEDEPNFSFREPPCSFYSGTKALGEEALADDDHVYVWRLRIPFDEFDHARNYLTKIQRYPKVYDNTNSISHRGDFVKACLDSWRIKAPFGVYNVTNPGWITTRQVVELMQQVLKPEREFEFWENDEEFYKVAAKTPRSNCVMDASKLTDAGVRIRSVHEALEASLRDWKSAVPVGQL